MSRQGHIFQINISHGGVPKHPIREAEVTRLGIVGDHQNDTEHHGGPERALCLFSLERILALQAEGHPIFPGSTGENVTVVGLDWSQVTAGTRLRLGDEVLVEVTRHTTPCATIRDSFLGGDYSRLSQKRHPGWSRVYARVLQPGRIRIGDAVRLLP
ncbi:MAG: MOSC domain-containing protein [Chloroflexi bacterium]|nr:MAG: MOSC domain-containing protein [Chloroflexota bacterium]